VREEPTAQTVAFAARRRRCCPCRRRCLHCFRRRLCLRHAHAPHIFPNCYSDGDCTTIACASGGCSWQVNVNYISDGMFLILPSCHNGHPGLAEMEMCGALYITRNTQHLCSSVCCTCFQRSLSPWCPCSCCRHRFRCHRFVLHLTHSSSKASRILLANVLAAPL